MEETLNGLTVTLTDDATMDNYGTDGEVRYYASAVDAAGNEYRVAWDTTNGITTAKGLIPSWMTRIMVGGISYQRA